MEPVEEIELTMPTGTEILVNGTPMQPLSGQTVGDAAVSWSISPSLPNGLQISATNGTIWGTPTETSSLVVYTVTAVTASGVSDSDTLSIMIQEDSDGDSIPDVIDSDEVVDGVDYISNDAVMVDLGGVFDLTYVGNGLSGLALSLIHI